MRGFADEGEHEGRSRPVIDVVGRADLFDLALAHDDDAVGKLQRFLLVVSDEDGGVAGAIVKLAQPAAQFLADLGIERAEGFVEQQDARLDRHGAGQCHTLALAAGKLVRIALFEPRKLDHIEEVRDALADLGLGRAAGGGANLQAEADVLGHRHMPEQGVMLEHEADIAILHGMMRGIFRAEEDLAVGWKIQPCDQPQERRLAGTGRTKQRDQFAGRDFQRHVVQRGEAVEFLADIVDANFHRAGAFNVCRRLSRHRTEVREGF